MSAYRAYSDRGVEFVGINIFDKEPDGRRFIRDRRIPYPAGFDAGDRIATLYGVEGTPTTVFITRSGRVMAIKVGGLDSATLREALEQLLMAR